jgi:hypothetical protein
MRDAQLVRALIRTPCGLGSTLASVRPACDKSWCRSEWRLLKRSSESCKD